MDKAVADFASRWPGRFATNSQIKEHITNSLGEEAGKNIKGFQHVVKRAGMTPVSKPLWINGKAERFVIVRGFDPAGFEGKGGGEIIKEITDAYGKFTLQPR
ncbi:hypothetical protein EN786_10520 [Mesorhizobium sp. M4B.F.Ca.ET.143.01.1.1]|nr:hypothetical protein EN786_10520 [Mesorhizobium sp. M4B.F.Ca.ET.143.01.1.1]